MRRLALALILLMTVPAHADVPSSPFTQDPLGPISDVTNVWQQYQPASLFCIQVTATSFPGGTNTTAADADCATSGLTGSGPAVKVALQGTDVVQPPCGTCRRLYIDFSKIPSTDSPPSWYAHGHAYLHLNSVNSPSYSVDPVAHSPNTKNFYNDKFVTPDGTGGQMSVQQQIVWPFDQHCICYVTDTAHFVHNEAQGPYYIGPWYLASWTDGDGTHYLRRNGIFYDVNLAACGQESCALPDASLNAIAYAAGFDSGDCPNDLAGPFPDGDAFYGGCVMHQGSSSTTVDPFPA